MSRWLLALLFAFGSVTFLTGCPAEEDKGDDTTTETEGEGEGETETETEGEGETEAE